MGNIPKSGKILIINKQAIIKPCTRIEDFLINQDYIENISHFEDFDSDQTPRSYFKIGAIGFEEKVLRYLWITHALPLTPKSELNQLRSFKKINGEYERIGKQEGLDLLVTTCTTKFIPKLMKQKYGFDLIFSLEAWQIGKERKPRYAEFFAYMKDLKNQLKPEQNFEVYKKIFPNNLLVKQYEKQLSKN